MATAASDSKVSADDTNSMFFVYETNDGKLKTLAMFDTQAEAEDNVNARKIDLVMRKRFNMSMKEALQECEKLQLEAVTMRLKLEDGPDEKEEDKQYIHVLRDAKDKKKKYGTFSTRAEAEKIAKTGKMIVWLAAVKNVNPQEIEAEVAEVKQFIWQKRAMVETSDDEKKHVVVG